MTEECTVMKWKRMTGFNPVCVRTGTEKRSTLQCNLYILGDEDCVS